MERGYLCIVLHMCVYLIAWGFFPEASQISVQKSHLELCPVNFISESNSYQFLYITEAIYAVENKNMIHKLPSVQAFCRNACLCDQHGTAFQRINFMRRNYPNELKQSFSPICDVWHILVRHDKSEGSCLSDLWMFAQITE